jgi:AcrR family transcriptional regulator
VVSGSTARRGAGAVAEVVGVGGSRGGRGGRVGRGGVVSGRVGAVSVRLDGVDLARGGVPEIQRARILGALVEVAGERGAGRVTVAHIVARSGVSRRTFYEMFGDRDECFLAAFQDAVQRAGVRVVPAFRGVEVAGVEPAAAGAGGGAGGGGVVWRESVRAGLLMLLEFFDEEPGLGGLCVVDALGAGPAVLESRAGVVARLVEAVDEGSAHAKGGLSPSRLTAEGVVGGVLAVLYARLAERKTPRHLLAGEYGTRQSLPRALVSLLNPLMGTIVLPYLGAAVAARELKRPTPRARRRAAQVRSNPLEGLDMRLTYRTVRVLVAIAASPRASNREIAEAAGVQDQGQISKLLARLEHLGLAENTGGGSPRGEPNAWRLTTRGRDVEQTIHNQTAPTAT